MPTPAFLADTLHLRPGQPAQFLNRIASPAGAIGLALLLLAWIECSWPLLTVALVLLIVAVATVGIDCSLTQHHGRPYCTFWWTAACCSSAASSSQYGTGTVERVTDHPVNGLDDVVHQRVRLGILAITHEARKVEFGFLRNTLELTAGNLSQHLTVLDNAGLITIEKATKADVAALGSNSPRPAAKP